MDKLQQGQSGSLLSTRRDLRQFFIDDIADVPLVAHGSFMNRLLLSGLLFFSAAGAAATEPDCQQPLGAVVPDAKTARAIAVAVINARQSSNNTKKYKLFVEPDGERSGSWIAFQARRPLSKSDSGIVVVPTGGGGIGMRIDRCSGEVSDMYYQR